MNKLFLITILLFTACFVSAQKKPSILHVIKSESAHHVTKNGVELLITYKGLFQQNNTLFSSDSAYLHEKENVLEAFGHVLITQGDTLNVYGDKLHYDGNTKIAIMTENVRMVDRDATLTTNYLTYSTATKIGTYTGGGKLVDKVNTLTSKNGYYFSSTRDAYFRYNVILNTDDAIIKTDTLRYNSGTRIAYFYGPTNIYGKKDNDTLYTENGTYNTQTEQAFFGKKNLYKQGTKSLKGDSLFYDRLAGYGKAIKNVVFNDREQKTTLYGGLGEYFKKEERVLMTVHPYVVFVTEEKDTTKKDTSTTKSAVVIKKAGSLTPPKDTMPVIDPVTAKTLLGQRELLTPPKNSNALIDSAQAKATILANQVPVPLPVNITTLANQARAKVKSVKKDGLNLPVIKIPTGLPDAAKTMKVADIPVVKKDTTHIRRDSIFMTADTIETQMMMWKVLRTIKEARLQAGLRDTSIKNLPSIVYTKPVKFIETIPLRMSPDTTIFHRDYFKKRPVAKDTTRTKTIMGAGIVPAPGKAANTATVVVKKPARPPARKIVVAIDSVNLSQTVTLSDTARVRVLTAAHHAKLFKSDLQAKADSISFSYSDSVARMYIHPMIWVQGSQMSGDTINLQMKRKQLDNLEMYPAGFIVNIERNDTTHFNQVGGKKMRGFFKDSRLNKMFVFGNAETIYYDRDSSKVVRMQRTISSKIRVNFKANEPLTVTQYIKPEARVIPVNAIKEDDKILKNFTWKPKDRPVSKESILTYTKPAPAKKTGSKAPPGKKKLPVGEPKRSENTVADSVKTKTDTLQRPKSKPDSVKVPVKRMQIDTAKRRPDKE